MSILLRSLRRMANTVVVKAFRHACLLHRERGLVAASANLPSFFATAPVQQTGDAVKHQMGAYVVLTSWSYLSRLRRRSCRVLRLCRVVGCLLYLDWLDDAGVHFN